MTDMDLNGRNAARSRRWRRSSRIVSGSLSVAALACAVYLGATGPLVSPVQPAAATAVVAPAQPVVGVDRHPAGSQGGPDDGRGVRDAGFDLGPHR